MANLSDLFGGGADGAGTVEEALPTFGLYACYSGSTYAQSVVSSSGSRVVSGYQYTSGEGWNNYSGVNYTQSGVSSNSDGSTSWFQATPNSQAEGHYRIEFPTMGLDYALMMKPYSNGTNNTWPYYGTVIGPEGFRQKISIWHQNDGIRVDRRGSFAVDYVTLTNGFNINTSGEPGTAGYGSLSYNSRINKLAVIRSDGSNNYRLHVWTNPNRNLNKDDYLAGDLALFIREAYQGLNGASYFYNNFSWSTPGSSSYSESRYHFRVIMGDNGYIGLVRFTPNYETRHDYILPNSASTSLLTNPTNVCTQGLTTTYGIEQGNAYGMRSNITWDNQTIIAYSPYYYYGSGLNAHFVDTANPTLGRYFQWSSTSYGAQPVPFGKHSFFVRYSSQNTNTSNGVVGWIFEGKSVKHSVNTSGNPVSNGSNMDSQTWYLDTDKGYTSTDYPYIAPMTSWTRVGK